MNRRRHILGWLGLAGPASALSALGGLAPGAARAAGDGTDAVSARTPWPRSRATPGLDLPTWAGPPWRLDEARGQVIVINFWASWCEPCRTELPSLELLAQRHLDDRVQVITVNHRETDGALRRYLAAEPLSLPVLRDRDGAASRAWGARVFPTTVVVDRKGLPAFSVVGEIDWAGADARRWLRELI